MRYLDSPQGGIVVSGCRITYSPLFFGGHMKYIRTFPDLPKNISLAVSKDDEYEIRIQLNTWLDCQDFLDYLRDHYAEIMLGPHSRGSDKGVSRKGVARAGNRSRSSRPAPRKS